MAYWIHIGLCEYVRTTHPLADQTHGRVLHPLVNFATGALANQGRKPATNSPFSPTTTRIMFIKSTTASRAKRE